MNALRKAFRFFHEWAGCIVGESAIGALALAKAEARAAAEGWTVQWLEDPESWMERTLHTEGPAWLAMLRDENGEVIGSLGMIDFGRNGEPWGQPYARVIAAELALEAIAYLSSPA